MFQHTRIKFTVSLTSWLWSRTLLEKPSGRSVSPNIYFSDMNGGGEIERRWLMLGVMHHTNPDSPWQADSCMTWRVMYVEPLLTVSPVLSRRLSAPAQTAVNLCFVLASNLPSGANGDIWQTHDEVFICNVWCPRLFYPLTACLTILQHIICFLLGCLE